MLQVQSLESVLEHVIPMHIPEDFTSPSVLVHMPVFLQDLIKLSPRQRAEKIHKEFFDIEQNEQKRLQKVLDWHCSQSVGPVVVESGSKGRTGNKHGQEKAQEEDQDDYHPFSISAGVEKGHLNRYKNMWPVSGASPNRWEGG